MNWCTNKGNINCQCSNLSELVAFSQLLAMVTVTTNKSKAKLAIIMTILIIACVLGVVAFVICRPESLALNQEEQKQVDQNTTIAPITTNPTTTKTPTDTTSENGNVVVDRGNFNTHYNIRVSLIFISFQNNLGFFQKTRIIAMSY